MKRNSIFSLVVLFVTLSAVLAAYPEKPSVGLPNLHWGWSDSEDVSRPIAVDASGAVIMTYGPNATAALALGPLPTPTIAMATTVAGTTASFTAAADRLYVMIQNHDTATSLWVAPAVTATMSQGIEVLPQSHILRPWGSSVPVSYIASEVISLTIEQGVLP